MLLSAKARIHHHLACIIRGRCHERIRSLLSVMYGMLKEPIASPPFLLTRRRVAHSGKRERAAMLTEALFAEPAITRLVAPMSGGLYPLPFWKDQLHAPANYQNFLCWACYYATGAELADCELLFSIEHRNNFSGSCPLAGNFPSGRKTLDVRECEDLDCVRCNTLQGGWKWNWVGPWTPESCHHPTGGLVSLTRENGRRPWPKGNLRGPGLDTGLTARPEVPLSLIHIRRCRRSG